MRTPEYRKLASVATSMPTPAQTMPLRAVTGEVMRFRPKMNRNAASEIAGVDDQLRDAVHGRSSSSGLLLCWA